MGGIQNNLNIRGSASLRGKPFPPSSRIPLACVQTSSLPQEKSGEDSRFFLREGGLLYTG